MGLFFWIIILVYGLFRLLAFFSCLVEIAVLFSTGCSQVGIPYLSLRGLLEDNFIHFHIQVFRPSYIFLHQHIFYRLLCCVAGCCSGGFRNPLFELVSHWRKDSLSWEIILEGSWTYFRSLASSQLFPIISSIVPAGNCAIFQGNLSEGSCGSFGVFSCD